MNACKKVMFKIFIVVLTFGTISCSKKDDKVLSDTNNILNSGKVISYCIDKCTVQGK